MMRSVAVVFVAALLLHEPAPAFGQFQQLIEIFKPKAKAKPKPRPVVPPGQAVPLPPMNPLHGGAKGAESPPETDQAAKNDTGKAKTDEAKASPPPKTPPRDRAKPAKAPAGDANETAGGKELAEGEQKEEKAKDVWSEAEIMQAQQRCIERLGPIVAEVKPLEPIKADRCGSAAPVRLTRIGADPGVEIRPAATLTCEMVLALHKWVENAVQPAARLMLGSPVVEFRNATSYNCRNRYNAAQGLLSEHALANALDISSFVTENGRRYDVLRFWGPTEREIAAARRAAEEKRQAEAERRKKAQAKTPQKVAKDTGKTKTRPGQGEQIPLPPIRDDRTPTNVSATSETEPSTRGEPQAGAAPEPGVEGKFLRAVHEAACGIFGTVLGPEANDAHKDHFHLDMKARRRSAFCE